MKFKLGLHDYRNTWGLWIGCLVITLFDRISNVWRLRLSVYTVDSGGCWIPKWPHPPKPKPIRFE